MSEPVDAYLVCGGRWHDFDFARVELLKLLGEHESVRTRVAEDFRDLDALEASDFLVTYTCDLEGMTPQQEKALASYVGGGRRWLALHGTNSVMEFLEDGRVAPPRTHRTLMETLGSRFIAHPPIAPYKVENVNPDHPLVAGIEPFEVDDELYLCEYYGEVEALLATRFTGQAVGFVDLDWADDEPRLVMYLHPVEKGQVLYLTLGHCRGRYDMRPLMDVYPRIERGSWESPVFLELLRRGLGWCLEGAASR
ncbi:MAG: ThuA domain-containing protein [Myxococcota bacterium]|nr:ThuA domain-containing protein [Myxococcota bacterium]